MPNAINCVLVRKISLPHPGGTACRESQAVCQSLVDLFYATRHCNDVQAARGANPMPPSPFFICPSLLLPPPRSDPRRYFQVEGVAYADIGAVGKFVC